MLLLRKRQIKEKSSKFILTGLPVKRDELIPLGTIVRTHGYDGTVIIKTERDYGEEIEEMESVFVEIDGIPVPFILTDCEVASKSLFVTFLGYESKELVTEFTGCRVLVRGIEREESVGPLPLHLIGFRLTCRAGKELGVITGVASFPMQIMLLVTDAEGVELMIPLHTDWIVGIDKKGEVIEMDLPEGLLSVNT